MALRDHAEEDLDGYTADQLARVVGASIVRGLPQLTKAMNRLLTLAVIGAFGLGAFFTMTTFRLDSLDEKVAEVRNLLGEKYESRLRKVEDKLERGYLPETRKRIENIDDRLHKLEEARR